MSSVVSKRAAEEGGLRGVFLVPAETLAHGTGGRAEGRAGRATAPFADRVRGHPVQHQAGAAASPPTKGERQNCRRRRLSAVDGMPKPARDGHAAAGSRPAAAGLAGGRKARHARRPVRVRARNPGPWLRAAPIGAACRRAPHPDPPPCRKESRASCAAPVPAGRTRQPARRSQSACRRNRRRSWPFPSSRGARARRAHPPFPGPLTGRPQRFGRHPICRAATPARRPLWATRPWHAGTSRRAVRETSPRCDA